MPNDGIVIASVCRELAYVLTGLKIEKIYQPEKDEIVLLTRAGRLLISASANMARVHFTQKAKQNPEKAPQFCMLLRKHLQGGRVTGVTQPEFERILSLQIESPDEMGDVSQKELIIEIMGKHSNIILVKNGIVLDCAKHVGASMSSVREVLPGRAYAPPPGKGKINPLNETKQGFFEKLNTESPPDTAILCAYNGISPAISAELVLPLEKNGNARIPSKQLCETDKEALYSAFTALFKRIDKGDFSYNIWYDSNKALDFHCLDISLYKQYTKREFSNLGEMADEFYAQKDAQNRISQKSADIKKLIAKNIERCVKKREMQDKALKTAENRDKYRLYGELITANIHNLKMGMTTAVLPNFYEESSPEIEVPLDSTLTPSENAQKHFKRYNKEKRAEAALKTQTEETKKELEYLEQLMQSLVVCETEEDLTDIRQELYEEGYVKKARASKKSVKKSKPLKFISSDGFDILVGKNNKQNEELTLKIAQGGDIWLHTKVIPGSHVIIRTNGANPPDTTIDEAAQIACYYSKGRNSQLVAVDYTKKKYVKKPAGAKTGMVIYENYKTAFVTASEQLIEKLKA